MREAETVGENATALAAIRLLLVTGLRRMEALALRREWVDGRAEDIDWRAPRGIDRAVLNVQSASKILKVAPNFGQ